MLRLCSPFRQFRSKRVVDWTKHASYFIDSSNDRNHSNDVTQFYKRHYGITSRRENPLIYGGIAVFVVGASAQMGMQAYEEYQANQAKRAKETPTQEPDKTNTTTGTNQEDKSNAKEGESSSKDTTYEEAGESLFSRLFSTTFYEGGFENKMTRREAALILGVRESANEKRIKDAHRRILVKNHPDRGGSAFLASKVNEAKDFLLKGKS